MNKQIKIGKITLECTLSFVKVIRYWKTDWNDVHLKDQSLERLKEMLDNMRLEAKSNTWWNQTMTYRATHCNTRRVIIHLIEVLETGVQSKPLVIS